MFRSAGSSQPAGRHYSVFGHLLNRASRTLPPIISCHYVGRVISHQFLSVVFFFFYRYDTVPVCTSPGDSGVPEEQWIISICVQERILRTKHGVVRTTESGGRYIISSANPPYLGIIILVCLQPYRFWCATFFFRHHGLFGRYSNRGFEENPLDGTSSGIYQLTVGTFLGGLIFGGIRILALILM